MDYIIVQAGGKGTRLKRLTQNKPKALVPVENLPMLFHLFKKYPDKRFVIIADYKKDVLREYLAAFANVKYQVVEAEGTGTCSGVSNALQLIPEGKSFMLVWSDLILPVDMKLPEEYDNDTEQDDYIGISKTFECRWSYNEGKFIEKKSYEYGVAGFFLFKDKSKVKNVPKSGELVRWMSEQNIVFKELSLAGTREFGLIEEYEKLQKDKCRPFNRITIEGDVLTKEAVDEQGIKLAQRECVWYEIAMKRNITGIPRIYSTHPLKMEYIDGYNIYDCNFSYADKKKILALLINTLKELHETDSIPADSFSMKEAYYNKTMSRLAEIENLVPFAREKTIRINGKDCRNVFYHRRELEDKLSRLISDKFYFIHGDCTFSNLMIRKSGEPVLIDPRGYFGYTEIHGDVRYDWAKLYYSIVGNYDKFNLKEFNLDIGEKEVALNITSNGWEDMEEEFFKMTGADKEEIKLLHAIIWLSLTTYAWQDYDSICGAFYNGLYYLEDVL